MPQGPTPSSEQCTSTPETDVKQENEEERTDDTLFTMQGFRPVTIYAVDRAFRINYYSPQGPCQVVTVSSEWTGVLKDFLNTSLNTVSIKAEWFGAMEALLTTFQNKVITEAKYYGAGAVLFPTFLNKAADKAAKRGLLFPSLTGWWFWLNDESDRK